MKKTESIIDPLCPKSIIQICKKKTQRQKISRLGTVKSPPESEDEVNPKYITHSDFNLGVEAKITILGNYETDAGWVAGRRK